MTNAARGAISGACAVVLERMSDQQIVMHLGSAQFSIAKEEGFQHSATQSDEFNTIEQDARTPIQNLSRAPVKSNQGRAGHEQTEYKESIRKHGILQLLGESDSNNASSQSVQKKKIRKERKSVERLMVKQNESSSFQQFNNVKRKTKKMAEMLDFLERERNVSLLNDICKSEFSGSRKRCKRNGTLSDKSSYSLNDNRFTCPFSSVSVESDSGGMKSIINNTSSKHSDVSRLYSVFEHGPGDLGAFTSNTPPNHYDISHLYPNLRVCKEETGLNNSLECEADSCNVSTTLQENTSRACSSSNETICTGSIQESNKESGVVKDTMECKESTPTLTTNQIGIEEGASSLIEESESPVLNLQITDVKGSAWIDQDDYTSDESALVIDEDIEARGSPFDDEGNQDSLFKKTNNVQNNSSEEKISTETKEKGRLQLPKFRLKMAGESNLKLEEISDSIVIDGCSSDESHERASIVSSYPLKIHSPLSNNESKVTKKRKIYAKPDLYVIEAPEENETHENSFSHSSCLKDEPLVRKIKLNKANTQKEVSYVRDTKYVSSLSSGRNERNEFVELIDSSKDSRLSEEDLIVDVESFKETEQGGTKNKECNEEFSLNSPPTLCDTSVPIVSSINIDSVGSINIVPGSFSDQGSLYSKQRGRQHNEFNVLRRHIIENENHTRRHAITRDPWGIKTNLNRMEPDIVKSRKYYRTNDQTSEAPCVLSDSELSHEASLGEFNKVIYVMYREMLTPRSQNLIGHLAEILYLVVSESVRYSDRFKKAKRLLSSALIVQEELMAHRDFQANTIFYGMYFTHLFRNVVQCFPASKAFYTFMYLALFVNLFRRLKSTYNVHSSYLHIARKLVVSMLRANAFDDIIMFSAMCKPDPVFETDVVLVSRLIDSFAENIKTPTEIDSFSHEMNYSVQTSQWEHDFHSARKVLRKTPLATDRNIIHPEFPHGRVTVTPMPIHPPHTHPRTQTHYVPLQTKPRLSDDSHCSSEHGILPKIPKLVSSKHPRALAYFSELERRSREILRSPFLFGTGFTSPRPVSHVSSSVSALASIPTSTLTATPPSTSIPTPRCISTATTSIPTSNPVDSSKPNRKTEQNQAKTSTTTFPSGRHQSQRPGIRVWRPTAIRPKFRPILPYYSYTSSPLLVNALTLGLPHPRFRYNCS